MLSFKNLSHKAIFVSCLAFSLSAYSGVSDKVDGEFVTLSGEVIAVSPNSFQLDVGENIILVEMDDYDWDSDGYKLVKEDKVVVTGRVDHDFLQRQKVEAGSVYVKGLDTFFYANSTDEEGDFHFYPNVPTVYVDVPDIPEGANVEMQGVVTKVDGREFTLNTGLRKVVVDTDDLIYNPMDNAGYTQIDKYDRVRVSGSMEETFFDDKELSAKSISEL